MSASMSLTVTQNSQSVANNTSSVTITTKVTTTQETHNFNGASFRLDISGSFDATYNRTVTFGKRTTKTIDTRTITVKHSSTGTAKITVSARLVTGTSSGTLTKKVTKTLTTIPRASVPTVTGTKQLGETLTINTNRKSTVFDHTISWDWADHSGTIGTDIGVSTTWTPSVETFAPYLTDAASDTCVIECVTKNGATTIGTKNATFTLSIPSSVVPSFTSSTIDDTAGYLTEYGAFIQGKSIIQVTALAEGVYGSTISSYSAALDAVSKTSSDGVLNLGYPNNAGEQTITLTATDTRGRSVTETKSITVVPYTNPELAISAYRYNNSTGVEDDESTVVRVEINGSVCDVNSKGLNTGTVKIEYKLSADSVWTIANEADRGQTFSFNYDISDIATTNKYDIRVTNTDSFGTVSETVWQINTAKPLMDFYKTGDGMAIGMIASKSNVLQLGYDLDLEESRSMQIGGVPFIQSQGTNKRPKIVNHIGLQNGIWFQAQTSGTDDYTDLFRMNETGEVEVNWTSGGLKGRVMKLLWEGRYTVSSGVTITLQDLPYYNLLCLYFDGRGTGVPVWRSVGNSPSIFYGGSFYSGNNAHTSYAASVSTDGSTKITQIRATNKLANGSTIGTSGTCTSIYGIL